MRYLPSMKYSDRIQQSVQSTFGGLCHRIGAGDGNIYDMRNMSSDDAPLLSSRSSRWIVARLNKPQGICALDGIFYQDGEKFLKDGVKISSLSDTPKSFAKMNKKIIIFPDKVSYNAETGEFEPLFASFTGTVTICDGTYADVDAKANTIKSDDADFSTIFKPGDAIEISGCTTHPENNTSLIIREVSDNELHFYENSFTINENGDSEKITLSRSVPDLDYICECDNRLWGVKGDRVYASKLGDPTNWNCFDGLSSDSWQTDVGSPGDFTGCITYLGKPCLFKEDVIYEIYGDSPSNFQLIRSASLGVLEGCSKSLAIAGEVLFYMSRTGIVAFSGSVPQNVFQAFGGEKFKNCIGGSDGRKYYVSLEKEDGSSILAVYDTTYNTWHIEDNVKAVGMAWNDGLYILSSDGTLWLMPGATAIPKGAVQEESVNSYVQFSDFICDAPNKKGISKIGLRLEAEAGAQITVLISYDSSEEWKEIKTFSSKTKKSFYLPLIPRRCDHFSIKIVSTGKWRLYSLTKEYYHSTMI